MGKRDLIISVFKTQCLKCPYCPFSSVSIKSSYCPYCPRVHKVSALSTLSSNEVSWLSGHPGWGGGVHPQRRSVTTWIYWLLHFGPWSRYTLDGGVIKMQSSPILTSMYVNIHHIWRRWPLRSSHCWNCPSLVLTSQYSLRCFYK